MPKAAKSTTKERNGSPDSQSAGASKGSSSNRRKTSKKQKAASTRKDPKPTDGLDSEKEPNYLIMVSIVDTSDPMITRTLSVPPTLSLANLHTVIQAAFGWANSHMHTFAVTVDSSDSIFPVSVMRFENRYGVDEEDSEDSISAVLGKTEDESKWSLKDVFEKEEWEVPGRPGRHPDGLEERSPHRVKVGEGEVQLMYEYDMGDSWEHQITLLGRATKRLHTVVGSGKIDAVICLGGEGHPCAEDCGAPPGWEGLKEAFKKKRGDPELKEWYKELCLNGDKKGLDPYKWNLLR